MSDAKLRDLERRWKETEAVEDEAAYLRGAVQGGAPERYERVRLCGGERVLHGLKFLLKAVMRRILAETGLLPFRSGRSV